MDVFDGSGRRLVTLTQAAELRGQPPQTLHSARSRGSLPDPAGFLDGRTPLWLEGDVTFVPGVLRRLDRWVLWRAEQGTKRPYRVVEPGRLASSTDPGTWASWGRACRAASGGDVDGVGFVVNGDGIVGVDLDDCLDNGGLDRVLGRFPATYTEVSPSGNGLRLFVRADLNAGFRRTVEGVSVEVYPSGRFLTVTGWRYGRTSKVAEAQGAVESLVS